jgi:hypothetical protein
MVQTFSTVPLMVGQLVPSKMQRYVLTPCGFEYDCSAQAVQNGCGLDRTTIVIGAL